MKNLVFSKLGVSELNQDELFQVNGGGAFADGEADGAAAGAYVHKILDGIGILKFVADLL